MKEDNQKLYEIWDNFLDEWPIERIQTMTLAEYNKVGNKETFCAWVERY